MIYTIMLDGSVSHTNLSATEALDTYYDLCMYHPSLTFYIVDSNGVQKSLNELESESQTKQK
jgi:hypothetical protein